MFEFRRLPFRCVFLIHYLALIAFIECQNFCPSPEDISPCTCYVNFGGGNFVCQNITSVEEIVRLVENAQRYRTVSFSLTHSSLQYIPKEVFKNVRFQILDFEEDSFVKLFEEIPRNPGVSLMIFNKVRIVGNWDWRQFSSFTDLFQLIMKNVPLRGLANFKQYGPKMISLAIFENCEVKKIHKDIFQDFPNLRVIAITHDKIKELKRTMFPKPAPQLRILRFDYNEISVVPEDLFVDMSLEELSLSHNLLTVLPENTYKTLLNDILDFDECKNYCPPPEDISPCTCSVDFGGGNFECQNITSVEQILPVIGNAQSYITMSFMIANSTLEYIPNDIFENAHFPVLIFEDDTFVKLFKDTPVNPDVYAMVFKKVQIIGNWDWKPFSAFTTLSQLKINSVPLRGLANFKEYVPKSVTLVSFENCGVKKIQKDAFQDLSNLGSIAIMHDKIKELKRTMFPRPAPQLHVMKFDYNEISTIPEDLFIDMDLYELRLSNNLLTTLPENTYKPVANKILNFDGNLLQCDCGMKWIVTHEKRYIYGTCNKPKVLEGRGLSTLTADDFEGCWQQENDHE